MLKNQSVATIAAPEFINIEPYNPLISQCEIKVLYVGENRNGSYITKEVAKNMANSLPGTPIVAAFLEEKDDFGDHGEVITIEDGEVKRKIRTHIPPRIYNFDDLMCTNEACISNDSQNEHVGSMFLRTPDNRFVCAYCGRVHTFKEIFKH